MARLREFDTDLALEAAMQTFWLNGYKATSLTDLMTAMGLKKGSIYKAFKDKHSLFILALRQYLDQSNALCRKYLENGVSPKAGVSNLLHNIICDRGNDKNRRGCFMLNSVVELAPHDEEVRKIFDTHLSYMQRILTKAIIKGQSLGEFRTDIPPEDLSLIVLDFLQGLVTRSKGSVSVESLNKQVDYILKMIAA